MLVSTIKLDKFDNEYVVEYYGIRFVYICFKRDRKLESILKMSAKMQMRKSITDLFKIEIDNFITSIYGLKEVVIDELKIYMSEKNITKKKYKYLYGEYEDLYYLNIEDIREILNRAYLKSEKINVWSMRVSNTYLGVK